MKRYIKSFTTEQLKAKLGDNYPKGGYLYIFKHGIGPGTLPRDVEVIKTKDLPNSYTAVWTDRFLTTSELKEYDIPSETEINRYLDRIDYCQRNGDVVPCDRVEACGNIKASTYVSQVWLPDDKKWEDIQEYNKWDNTWCEGCGRGPYYDVEDARADGYRARIIVRDESGRYVDEVEACNSVMASTDIGTGDFTVIQEIYDDGYVYMTEDNVEPVYTQEYDVSLAEVLTKYPEAEKYALKGWTDETFKPGDIITQTHFAKYVEYAVGDEQMYADYKDYVAQHPEFDKPGRQVEVRINNPRCLPSAEEERRKQGEELGKRLGKMLGLGRY